MCGWPFAGLNCSERQEIYTNETNVVVVRELLFLLDHGRDGMGWDFFIQDSYSRFLVDFFFVAMTTAKTFSKLVGDETGVASRRLFFREDIWPC